MSGHHLCPPFPHPREDQGQPWTCHVHISHSYDDPPHPSRPTDRPGRKGWVLNQSDAASFPPTGRALWAPRTPPHTPRTAVKPDIPGVGRPTRLGASADGAWASAPKDHEAPPPLWEQGCGGAGQLPRGAASHEAVTEKAPSQKRLVCGRKIISLNSYTRGRARAAGPLPA